MEKLQRSDTQAPTRHLLSVARGHELVEVPEVEPHGPTVTAGLQPPGLDGPPEGDGVERCVFRGPRVIQVGTLRKARLMARARGLPQETRNRLLDGLDVEFLAREIHAPHLLRT